MKRLLALTLAFFPMGSTGCIPDPVIPALDDDTTGDDDDSTPADTIPQAAAAANPTSGIAPLDVQFSGLVAGGDGPLTFAWSFGDGSGDNIQDPVHTYGVPGTFYALFEVWDSDGDYDSDTVPIAVGSDDPADAAPALSINANPVTGDIPLTVIFAAVAVGGDPPLTFAWDFDDGGTSTNQNPSHVFTSAGTFVVECTVTDDTGDTDTRSVTVIAFDPNAPPTAPELTGYSVDVEWVNVPTNGAEIYEPNNRSLWAYDFETNEGPASSYSATGWLDPAGELRYSVAVTNVGLGTPNLFWVDLFNDPGYVPQPADPGVGDEYDYIWGLPSGFTEMLTFVWPNPPAIQTWYESYAVIDADEQVPEGDESDNVVGPIDAFAGEDWDWYEVYLYPGDTLDLFVEVPANCALDYDLDIYGPDAVFDAVAYAGNCEDESLVFVADQEGPWWIRVYSYDPVFSGDPADFYLLTVDIY